MSEAGLGGADQQDGGPVQHQSGAFDLGSLSRSLGLVSHDTRVCQLIFPFSLCLHWANVTLNP